MQWLAKFDIHHCLATLVWCKKNNKKTKLYTLIEQLMMIIVLLECFSFVIYMFNIAALKLKAHNPATEMASLTLFTVYPWLFKSQLSDTSIIWMSKVTVLLEYFSIGVCVLLELMTVLLEYLDKVLYINQ